jgi:hypothetical protein
VRVVVSGGTGFVGRALCHSLVGRGATVTVLTRGKARDFSHACSHCGKGGTLELVSWTPEAEGPWMKLVDGADAVVHLAGEPVVDQRWTPSRKAVLRSSRIESTRLLAEAIARADERPKAFVSCSAVGLYGMNTGDAVVTEEAPPGSDFLATLVVDWEAAAAAARGAGVRVTHPRIGLVLGPNGGIFGRLAPIFRAFVGGPLGGGEQYMPWVHLRDTVRALEAMIDREDLVGPYNVTAPEPVTMNRFAAELGESLRRPAALRVPSFAVRAMLGSEAAEALLTGQRAEPKRLVEAGFAFVFPDLRSALADVTGIVDTD